MRRRAELVDMPPHFREDGAWPPDTAVWRRPGKQNSAICDGVVRAAPDSSVDQEAARGPIERNAGYEDSPQSERRPAYEVDEDPKEEQVQRNIENIVGHENEAWPGLPDQTIRSPFSKRFANISSTICAPPT